MKWKIASLKALCNYLVDEEILDQSPFSKIRITYKEPKKLPKTVPFSEMEKLLSKAHEEMRKGNQSYLHFYLRDTAVLELLFATGVRVSELSNLHDYDVDLDNGVIHIFGKGSKERVIQIENSAVIQVLRQYHDAYRDKIVDSGYFFINRSSRRLSEQSVRHILSLYVHKAQIAIHITPHMIRHSFATLMLDGGVNIRYIQQLLGHSSISTTQIYTYVSMGKQKEILALKHPRNMMKV